MLSPLIELDFGTFKLEATLLNTPISERFAELLPYTIDLTRWGNEVYGPVGANLGKDAPVPELPEGGIAYTNKGNYVCIFFGQTPAWPVEHIGQITDNSWQKLLSETIPETVTIRLK